MGLDMYLNGSVYASRNDWKAFDALPQDKQDLKSVPQTSEYKAIIEASGIADYVAPDGVGLSVEFIAGYWRKANQIHEWFVKNCGGGERDYGLYVSREDLQSLVDTCKEVLADKSKAKELLPTASGFFFGSTEYDEYYFQDLKETIKIAERCLKMPDRISFSYDSSW